MPTEFKSPKSEEIKGAIYSGIDLKLDDVSKGSVNGLQCSNVLRVCAYESLTLGPAFDENGNILPLGEGVERYKGGKAGIYAVFNTPEKAIQLNKKPSETLQDAIAQSPNGLEDFIQAVVYVNARVR